MSDLERARAILLEGGYTCVLTRGETIHTATGILTDGCQRIKICLILFPVQLLQRNSSHCITPLSIMTVLILLSIIFFLCLRYFHLHILFCILTYFLPKAKGNSCFCAEIFMTHRFGQISCCRL